MPQPFVQVPKSIAQDPKIGANALRVYVALRSCRNQKSGLCNPSNETLAEYTGLSLSQIKRAIRQLVEAGVIERHQWFKNGRQTTSHTTFPAPRGVTGDTPGGQDGRGVTGDRGEGVTGDPPRGVTGDPQNKTKEQDKEGTSTYPEVEPGSSRGRGNPLSCRDHERRYDPNDPLTWLADDAPPIPLAETLREMERQFVRSCAQDRNGPGGSHPGGSTVDGFESTTRREETRDDRC